MWRGRFCRYGGIWQKSSGVFEKIDPSELSACLRNWVSAEREKRSIVAIDGKTISGSGNAQHKAYHVISAFVGENHLTLGELTVEEKTN